MVRNRQMNNIEWDMLQNGDLKDEKCLGSSATNMEIIAELLY